MQERLTKRYIIKNINNLQLSKSIHYERYYINNYLRIQKKDGKLEKEVLNENNVLISKEEILESEFNKLKKESVKKIIRNSYLYLPDPRVSIKVYHGDYEGLNRVEVKFVSKEELENYKKEIWMGEEITNSPLAFDKYLKELTKEKFIEELKKYLKK